MRSAVEQFLFTTNRF